MVLSSMIMKRPNDTATSVHHFLFSSAKILALILSPLLVDAKLALASLARASMLAEMRAAAIGAFAGAAVLVGVGHASGQRFLVALGAVLFALGATFFLRWRGSR